MIWVRGDLALVEELARRDDVAHSTPIRRSASRSRSRGRPPTSRPRPSSGTSPRSAPPRSGRQASPARAWSSAARTRATTGTIPRCRPSTGAGTAPPPITTTTGTTPSIPAAAAAAPNSPVPCDDVGHGTHTMGTMVGDDGAANQIGVAPGAKWMGCRNMDVGNGTPATYSECFQWFIAPTNLANQNPDPTKAPHVINNSWGCPPSEGCTDPECPAHRGREHARGRHRGRGLGRQQRLGLQHRDRPARDLRRVVQRRVDDEHAQRRHLGLQQPRSRDHRRQQPPEAQHLGARVSGVRSSLPERRLRQHERHQHGRPARRGRGRRSCSPRIRT